MMGLTFQMSVSFHPRHIINCVKVNITFIHEKIQQMYTEFLLFAGYYVKG